MAGVGQVGRCPAPFVALFLAMTRKRKDVVRMLLGHPTVIACGTVSADVVFAMMLGCSEDMCSMMFDSPVFEVNSRSIASDDGGCPALLMASIKGKPTLVRSILQRADLDLSAVPAAKPPLEAAALSGHHEIAKMIEAKMRPWWNC